MWIADLEPWSLFADNFSEAMRAVGWIERDHDFPIGTVDIEVFQRLTELLLDPWQPFVSMGCHECQLCLYRGPSGNRNLFVPSQGIVFVCPELITHYMNAHGYRPPSEFCRAVMNCPPMRSLAYFRELLANGGRSLVQSAK